jgi:hypothetical protein
MNAIMLSEAALFPKSKILPQFKLAFERNQNENDKLLRVS